MNILYMAGCLVSFAKMSEWYRQKVVGLICFAFLILSALSVTAFVLFSMINAIISKFKAKKKIQKIEAADLSMENSLFGNQNQGDSLLGRDVTTLQNIPQTSQTTPPKPVSGSAPNSRAPTSFVKRNTTRLKMEKLVNTTSMVNRVGANASQKKYPIFQSKSQPQPSPPTDVIVPKQIATQKKTPNLKRNTVNMASTSGLQEIAADNKRKTLKITSQQLSKGQTSNIFDGK
jgi:hypothetical protein